MFTCLFFLIIFKAYSYLLRLSMTLCITPKVPDPTFCMTWKSLILFWFFTRGTLFVTDDIRLIKWFAVDLLGNNVFCCWMAYKTFGGSEFYLTNISLRLVLSDVERLILTLGFSYFSIDEAFWLLVLSFREYFLALSSAWCNSFKCSSYFWCYLFVICLELPKGKTMSFSPID